MIRKCNTCKELFPATNEFFYKSKDRPLGLDYRCKVCDKLRKDPRKWSERYNLMSDAQKEKSKENKRIYNKTKKGRSYSTLKAYQKFDKIKNFDNDLDINFVFSFKDSPCVYCGYPSTGLDRIDNSIGHLKSNCVACCAECNIARNNNFTYTEMFLIGKTIKIIKDEREMKSKIDNKDYILENNIKYINI